VRAWQPVADEQRHADSSVARRASDFERVIKVIRSAIARVNDLATRHATATVD
jgi:hypothetical protein